VETTRRICKSFRLRWRYVYNYRDNLQLQPRTEHRLTLLDRVIGVVIYMLHSPEISLHESSLFYIEQTVRHKE